MQYSTQKAPYSEAFLSLPLLVSLCFFPLRYTVSLSAHNVIARGQSRITLGPVGGELDAEK
jgi:hypothetical protein